MIHTTVVIPSLHSLWIKQVLDALHHQKYDLAGTEVLVVGQDRYNLVNEDTLIRFIDTKQPVSPAKARNMGIRVARGDLICFIDADCIPHPEWLAKLTAPYREKKVHVVGGVITFHPNYWTLCDTLAFFSNVVQGVESGPQPYLPSLNFCVHRQVFTELGIFDESFPLPAGEDTELTKRMVRHGYTLWLAEDAVLHHLAHRKGPGELWRRARHFGESVAVPSLLSELRHSSFFFRSWLMLLTCIPWAFWVTFRIYWGSPPLRRYWYAAPMVFTQKLVWVVSAALAIARAEGFIQSYRSTGETE